MSTKVDTRHELANIQLIIEQLAHGKITEEQAQQQLEAIWERVYDEPFLRKFLHELLPSITRQRKAASG